MGLLQVRQLAAQTRQAPVTVQPRLLGRALRGQLPLQRAVLPEACLFCCWMLTHTQNFACTHCVAINLGFARPSHQTEGACRYGLQQALAAPQPCLFQILTQGHMRHAVKKKAPARKGGSGPWQPSRAGRSRRSSATNALRSALASDSPGGGRTRPAPRFLRSRCATNCVSRVLGSLGTPAPAHASSAHPRRP